MAASILIADDDAVARRLVENMVQKCGYETVVVESGDAAIALLTGADAPAIDAVVLDLVMPGLDGMGVLAKIREETDEIEAALDANANRKTIAGEVGDLLFAVANLARHLKADPEAALRATNAKFERRFAFIETTLEKRGVALADATLVEMDALWNEAKAAE